MFVTLEGDGAVGFVAVFTQGYLLVWRNGTEKRMLKEVDSLAAFSPMMMIMVVAFDITVRTQQQRCQMRCVCLLPYRNIVGSYVCICFSLSSFKEDADRRAAISSCMEMTFIHNSSFPRRHSFIHSFKAFMMRKRWKGRRKMILPRQNRSRPACR
jgi:hypothetical protein